MIPRTIGREGTSVPKLIDEYYWVTIAKGCKPPDRSEVQKWAVWV